MPWLLTAFRFLKPFLPYLAAALVLFGVYHWITGMRSTIAEQKVAIGNLKADLATETARRERDVAALTTLSEGLAKAATDSKQDAAILQETVKDATAPASPQLRAFLDGLRAADARRKPAPATPGAGR